MAAGSPDGWADISGVTAPGVTVIVCAWNERENLDELLPFLDRQIYPNYEVIVMDDRSTDGTREWLESVPFGRVRTIRIDKEYDHVTPKKYALTIGIKSAAHELILLTDADCRPASEHWISGMVAHMAQADKEIVLGFSPYERRSGWLNRLIRYETLYTAVQYLSLALAGRPYMGVGRNLLYRRELFLRNRGFYSHIRVLGGDDDLFINEVGTARNAAVSLHPETFTWSKPKETFAAWRHQKRRHLSVGRHYAPANKLILGLLTASHILTWTLGLAVGLLALGNPLYLPYQVAGGVLLGRWLLFWLVVGRISLRLGHTVHWAGVPLMDIALSLYYSSMGVVTLLTRRKKTTWR